MITKFACDLEQHKFRLLKVAFNHELPFIRDELDSFREVLCPVEQLHCVRPSQIAMRRHSIMSEFIEDQLDSVFREEVNRIVRQATDPDLNNTARVDRLDGEGDGFSGDARVCENPHVVLSFPFVNSVMINVQSSLLSGCHGWQEATSDHACAMRR